MTLQIKRYLFWLFFENTNQRWFDFWITRNVDSYMTFRYFARTHALYDDYEPMDRQDMVTMCCIASQFFGEEITSEFDFKFYIWKNN